MLDPLFWLVVAEPITWDSASLSTIRFRTSSGAFEADNPHSNVAGSSR
jgi:hypothetical protein